MMYVVEERNGNPTLLKLQGNGSYKALAFGAGENKLDELLELAKEANFYHDDDGGQG